MQFDRSLYKKGMFIRGGSIPIEPSVPTLELDDDVPTLDDIGARIDALKKKIADLRRK
jgi:hypothetical protein